MSSVGRTLRTERISQNRELSDIADELCVAPAYLTAIESDNLKNLPGSFFYKSFVSQYANALGLDYSKLKPGIEALVGAHDAEMNPVPIPAPGSPAVRKHRSPIRVPDPILEAANKLDLSGRSLGLSVAGLALALVACSSFYSWWSKPSERFAPSPSTTANGAILKPVSSSNANPSGVNITSDTEADGLRHVVLSVSATESTWVSITSGGKTVFQGILAPSESKTLEGLEAAKLKVGNAGGLDVKWNGKAIGPIGKSGQVKTVVLTQQGVDIMSDASSQAPIEPTADTL
ncbi:MAG: helix-turn-helix domain-containing protein [Acidobacteriota bacterium]